MELNSREGAWERLSRERDPLVLSSLMWSWLEQLKDPVISSEDIKALSEKNVNAQSSLDSLEKVAGSNTVYLFLLSKCSEPGFHLTAWCRQPDTDCKQQRRVWGESCTLGFFACNKKERKKKARCI